MTVNHIWYMNDTDNIAAEWHYVSGLFSFLCLLFGLISNGLVILVFLRNDVLRRPRNYFLINLAITDVGLLLTNSSMHAISSFKKQWIFGQAGCDFYSVCGGVFGLTSIATMALISLTRLAAVNDPFSSLKLSSRFTLNTLVCAWIYGSIWIMPPLFGWNRFLLEGFGTSCTFDYVSKNLWDRAYVMILVIGGFIFPLSVIFISYTFILFKLSQRSRRFIPPNTDETYSNQQGMTYYFNQLNSPNDHRARSATPTTFDYMADDNKMTRNARRTEARATRTALLICALFCLAWGPYALMTLFSLFNLDVLVNPYTTSTLGLFTKIAACINPLVYALSLNGFREQICSYLKYICPCDKEHRHRLIPVNPDLIRVEHPNILNNITTRQSDRINGLN